MADIKVEPRLFHGIPLPRVTMPDTIPEEERVPRAEAYLQHQMDQDPEFFDRHIRRLGLNAADVDVLSRGTVGGGKFGVNAKVESSGTAPGTGRGHQAETEDIPWYGRAQTGLSRTGDSIQNAFHQIINNPTLVQAALYSNTAGLQARPVQNRLESYAGIGPRQLNEADRAMLAEKSAEATSREALQRREFAALDDDVSSLGTTIGLEDLGQAIPEALAFAVPGGGVIRGALTASLAAGMEGRTDGESRAEAMAMAGVFGLAVPGAVVGATRALAVPAEFGGRALIGLAGSVAGMRGFGRITSLIAKLGGIARGRQTEVALAMEAQHIMQEAAHTLRPVIEGMSQRQVRNAVKQAFRNDMRENFQKSMIQEAGQGGGLNIAKWLTTMEGYKNSTIRTKLGPKWGRAVVDFRSEMRDVAPRLAVLSNDPTLQRLMGRIPLNHKLMDGVVEYFGGGTRDALGRALSVSARRKTIEVSMSRLFNSLFAQKPDDVSQEEWNVAMAPYMGGKINEALGW